jgi:hypothetical protein
VHNLLLAALFFPAWLGPQTGFQDGPRVEPLTGEITFAGQIRFTAHVVAPEPISAGRLILEYGSARYAFFPREEQAADGFLLSVEGITLAPQPFPFTDVAYWWEVDLLSGAALVSPAQTAFYYDDRFTWNELSRNTLRLYWMEGSPEAADDLADLALLSLGTISAELETPIPSKVMVVEYARLADFNAALGARIRGWEGAVSSPETATIILAAAPGAEGRSALVTLLPHEIAHILIAARWGSGYDSIPVWLLEGTAAGYEMEPRPEAEFQMREAVKAGSAIPIRSLCRVYPAEEASALLAYAESKSFVAFLKERHGIAAIRSALGIYAGGADCDAGIEIATGEPLEALESAWIGSFSDRNAWISSGWVFVLAGISLLAGVLLFRELIRRGILKRRHGKGG